VPYLAIVLLLAAILLFWLAARQRRSAGLPGGRVIYADTSRWNRLEKPLYDPILGLTGKPDYLVDQGDEIIPVEVKSHGSYSGRVMNAPYDSHIFQLAAYCLLVERTYGKRPGYGIIHYPKQTFAVDYTPELESALTSLVNQMQEQARRKLDRSHEAPERCARCGFRSVCDQSLRI